MERSKRLSQLLVRCLNTSSPLIYKSDPGSIQKHGVSYVKQSYRSSTHITSINKGNHKVTRNSALNNCYQAQQRIFCSASINIHRNPSFSNLKSDDISYFKEILGENTVVQDEDKLQAANMDWMHKYDTHPAGSIQKRGVSYVKQSYRSSNHITSINKGNHKDTRNSALNNCYQAQQRIFCSASINIHRNPSFSNLKSDDISYFKEILGENSVVQDEDKLQAANMDWMRKYKGSSQLMLLPKSTEQVSKILQYCNSMHLAVVPQGGNTGLVGGSVPVYDEVIINVGSMNNIITFDKVNGILTCEAGCILENLSTFLENEGYAMPLDLGAKGSCQIGGNISTNAGGLHFIRYGSLHGNILGLEVVLANGTVLDMLTTLRKDNTGYGIKHLFIGSEGTLGIITKISILTPTKQLSTNVAFLACQDFLSCQKLLFEAKRNLGNVISAFEFMDSHAMDLALGHLDGVRNPLPQSSYSFYVLIETTGSDESYDKAKLEAFLLRYMEDGLVSDGVIAQDSNQSSSFWRLREGLSEASMKQGAVYKYDLSLPVEKLYDIVDEMRARLGQVARVIGYGHLGDGNLHLNIMTPKHDENVLAQIEPFVYEWTSNHRGSISAEHGLGLMKADKIHYSKSPEAVEMMVSIKKLLDPNRILNPYKVLPKSLVEN